VASGHEESPNRREINSRKDSSGRGGQPTQFYKVLFSAPTKGFELAEHKLSKQLLFVFRAMPELDLAGELEMMGFDRTDDERMYTLDATPGNKLRALKLAERYGGTRQGNAR
jgi:hypothetical protein